MINCKLTKNRKKCLTGVRGIIKKDNKILLIQRHKNGSCPNCWEFPGGKTDGQNPKNAIIREVKEETGIKLKNIKYLKTKKDGKYYVKYFEGKPMGTIKLQKSEAQDYGWFTRNQAKRLKLVNHTRKLI